MSAHVIDRRKLRVLAKAELVKNPVLRFRMKGAGHPGRSRRPAGAVGEITATLADAMTALLHEVQDAYGPHPAGEAWVPARLGGSAPIAEEIAD